MVSASRLDGEDHPLEVVYFVEGPSGQRMPATEAANLLNSMDVQRAAIILGYRVQGILAQRKYVQKEMMRRRRTVNRKSTHIDRQNENSHDMHVHIRICVYGCVCRCVHVCVCLD